MVEEKLLQKVKSSTRFIMRCYGSGTRQGNEDIDPVHDFDVKCGIFLITRKKIFLKTFLFNKLKFWLIIYINTIFTFLLSKTIYHI